MRRSPAGRGLGPRSESMGEQAMSLGLGSEVALWRGAGHQGRYSARVGRGSPGPDWARGNVPSVPGSQACVHPLLEKALEWTPPDLAIWWPSGSRTGGVLPPDIGRPELEREPCPMAHLTTGSQRRCINATLGIPNPVTASVSWIPFPISNLPAEPKSGQDEIQTFLKYYTDTSITCRP